MSDPFEDAPESGALGPAAADYGERDAEADVVVAELVNEQAGDDDDAAGEVADAADEAAAELEGEDVTPDEAASAVATAAIDAAEGVADES